MSDTRQKTVDDLVADLKRHMRFHVHPIQWAAFVLACLVIVFNLGYVAATTISVFLTLFTPFGLLATILLGFGLMLWMQRSTEYQFCLGFIKAAIVAFCVMFWFSLVAVAIDSGSNNPQMEFFWTASAAVLMWWSLTYRPRSSI